MTITSFLDPEGGSQNATVVVVLVGISSLKIPQGFLNTHYYTQRSATKLCMRIRAHIPYRSTAVSDFKLISD